ncbi:hypothetical protein [Lewinella sp. IMCC34191]|uniref:hypothetical protein n=1 Tax=Lewinella sp. IMCC34191 TaxID=2259172 RepID=UPI000E2518CD|nr:hypothetical protein [Lewinella sp. IMCC34191]
MLPFRLIGQPEYRQALQQLSPERQLDLLVVYHGELARRAFLGRILAAAGYRDPGTQLHLLEWPASDDLDLTGLIRELKVTKVILFGYTTDRLGLHIDVANYFPVSLAGVTYLLADGLEYIEQTKDAGDNRAAGALWKAIQQDFKNQ